MDTPGLRLRRRPGAGIRVAVGDKASGFGAYNPRIQRETVQADGCRSSHSRLVFDIMRKSKINREILCDQGIIGVMSVGAGLVFLALGLDLFGAEKSAHLVFNIGFFMAAAGLGTKVVMIWCSRLRKRLRK